MTIRKNILIIILFIATLLALFINKLTTPRTLSTNELLINGPFLYEKPKEISDFTFFTADGAEFNKANLKGGLFNLALRKVNLKMKLFGIGLKEN